MILYNEYIDRRSAAEVLGRQFHAVVDGGNTTKIHPANVEWIQSLPEAFKAEVREILKSPHSTYRVRLLRDALSRADGTEPSSSCFLMVWLPVCQCFRPFLGDPCGKPSTWTAVRNYNAGLTSTAALRAFAMSEHATLTRLSTTRKGPVYQMECQRVVKESLTAGGNHG